MATLQSISEKRKGGVYNFRGIGFQIHYTILKLLTEFQNDNSEAKKFQLEGIEDLDMFGLKNEFFQIKCLNTEIDSTSFSEKILPNLIEVFEHAPDSLFTIISNKYISAGKLGDLKDSSNHGKPLKEKAWVFWHEKIKAIRPSFSDEEIRRFLSQIRFEYHKEDSILTDIRKILIEAYGLANGNIDQFIQALFYFVFIGSIEKKFVIHADIKQLFQKIKDEIATGVENKAIKEGWIQSVVFEQNTKISTEIAYFEGKAARPWHIAAGFPVARKKWQEDIISTISDFEITVIKASSGQGKSTLAWQVAQILQEQGYSIFELTEIGTEGLQDLVRFMESRLEIGYKPLIVLDGLNERNKNWAEFAKRIQHLPLIKLLITAREEDWYRYGSGTSNLYLKTVNVEFLESEARPIYEAFQQRRLIHHSIYNWQMAWEKVEKEHLLIEFVYLLTQGKMLHERLSDQMSAISNDPGNSVKKDILRIVSAADVMGLTIPVSSLVLFIKSQIGGRYDIDDLLESLKNEYHVQVAGTAEVEGLHPVRSKHLLDLLHRNLPLSDTLVTMLSILQGTDLFIFASQAPLILNNKNEEELFLHNIASYAVNLTYAEITELIYGIYATDAYKHWLKNKAIFDKISNSGMLLYSTLSAPFNGLEDSDLRSLVGSFNPDFEHILTSIIPFDLQKTSTAIFVKKLIILLKNQSPKKSLVGLMSILRWAERFEIPIDNLFYFTIGDMSVALNEFSLSDLGVLYYGIFKIYEPLYRSFYALYGQEIIMRLRLETNTIDLYPLNDKTLIIRYIVNNQDPVDPQSVTRIETIARCLPIFETYDTAGIYFPNPVIELLRSRHDGSVKHATWENWLKYDWFITRGNQTWIAVIDQQYEFSTFYEWQDYWVGFRKLMLDVTRQMSRILEGLMNGNWENEINQWDALKNKIWTYRNQERAIRYDDISFPKEKHKDTVKKITDWDVHARNVLGQFVKLNDMEIGRVLKLNANSMWHYLPEMQKGFDEIVSLTHNYFEAENNILVAKEISSYSYFAKVIAYYHDVFLPNKRPVSNVRNTVKIWQQEKIDKISEQLATAKYIFDASSQYELVLPKTLIEEEYYNEVVLGIRGLNQKYLVKEFPAIMVGLLSLKESNIQFYHLVFIEGDRAQTNQAIRFSKEVLEKIKDELDGKPTEYLVPLPEALTSELLSHLPNIQMAENISDDPLKTSLFQMQECLWKYSEIKKRTEHDSSKIKNWVNKQLMEFRHKMRQYLKNIEPWPFYQEKYRDLFEKVEQGFEFDARSCQEYYLEDIVKNSN